MKEFTNSQQALMLFLASMLAAFGTMAASFPIEQLPDDIRWIVAVFFWVVGALTFALKELGGYVAPKEA